MTTMTSLPFAAWSGPSVTSPGEVPKRTDHALVSATAGRRRSRDTGLGGGVAYDDDDDDEKEQQPKIVVAAVVVVDVSTSS